MSFNAVRPQATHRVMSVKSADEMGRQINRRDKPLEASVHPSKSVHPSAASKTKISAAITTGELKCGNLGCIGMKKFSCIGSIVTWAHALERLNAHWRANALVDPGNFSDAKNTYYFRDGDMVLFPKRKKDAMRVHELREKKSVSEDEWMYQLEEGAANDPHKMFNEAMSAAIGSDWDTAGAKFADYDAKSVKEEEEGGLPARLRELLEKKEPYAPWPLLYH